MTQTPRGRPRKRFGQHFLERAWVDKVLRAIAPGPDDAFIEIGPGRGALTRPLAAQAGSVLAFEIDRDLAAALEMEGLPNVRVIEGDFLERSAQDVAQDLRNMGVEGPVRVAGNLPYYVASPIMFRLLDLVGSGVAITEAVLMLQKEVADRLAAAPGSRDYGVLSVLIQHRARVERLVSLPPGAFRPPPKVQSALVRLSFHPPDPPAVDHGTFQALTQAVFTRRRKTLANALLAYPPSAHLPPVQALTMAGLDGRRRPETLAVSELVHLSDVYARAVL